MQLKPVEAVTCPDTWNMLLFRELQRHRERIMDRLTASQQEQTVSEEQRIAKAVAEQEAKRQRQWREEEERRVGMLKSITAHREMMVN